jgi:PAS domain S-box-containing protein
MGLWVRRESRCPIDTPITGLVERSRGSSKEKTRTSEKILSMRKVSILLADGERKRAGSLARRLTALGFGKVIWASEVDRVREHLVSSPPDLLIVARSWIRKIPPHGSNGHRAPAYLVLDDQPRPLRLLGSKRENLFSRLPYPINDNLLCLIVGGALLARGERGWGLRSEDRFRILADTISDYTYSVVIGPDGSMSRQWSVGGLEEISGFSEEEIEERGGWRALVHPEDLHIAEAQLKSFLRGNDHVCEFRIVRRDGSVRWLRHEGRVTLDEETGSVAQITVVASDITTEHGMKEALRESEERWQFALDASGEGVWDWDVETGSVYHSDRWRSITGFDVDPASDGVSEYMKHIHPDDRKPVADEIRRFFRDESKEFEAEYRLQIGDGSYHWVLDRGKIVGRTPNGRPRRVVGTIADVTIRRQAEDDLARTNEFLRGILEGSSTIAIMSTDAEGVIQFWNSGAENLLGYNAAEAVHNINLRTLQAVDDEAAPLLVDELADLVIRQKQTISRVLREVHKDGSIVWLKMSFAPRLDRQGVVRGMLGIGENLTAQVHAQAVREQRERELRLLAFTLNCALDGFCITDLNYSILYVNDSFRATFGYEEDELLGQNISVLRSPEVELRMLGEIDEFTRKKGWRGSIRGRRKDGSEFPVEVATSIVRNDQGEPVAIVGVTRDITERVRADERIRASLKEKEVMLKEIHHRVKNNLQVISSLLNLQSAQEQNPAILAALKESQGRVRSMALVHEELYRSSDLADIAMDSYIRKLTANLFFAYQSTPARITLDIKARDVYLPIDAAVPCGLIINELVSNALKHAFKQRDKGLISIRFHHDGSAHVLVVSDDGVGLPKDLDIENTESLGLQLVSTLTKQLRGTIEVTRTQGTSFSMSFALLGKQTNA